MARPHLLPLVAATALVAAAMVGPDAVAPPTPARAAAGPPPGAAAAHPRLLMDPGTGPDLAAKVAVEPLRSVFVAMVARADAYDDRPLGDPGIVVQRDLTRAAKIRAFQYAIDRTVVGGTVVAFPDAAARDAAGDFARDVLVQIHDRSRLAVDPPVGGWDRDISTSEEIVNAATAYDLLLGAGYDLGADRAEIVRRLASVTDELRTNFVDLSTAGGVAQLHQNNHRTKSGAAMAVAAVALGGDVDDELARRWWDTGVDLVDDVQRHVLITGDGAYAEGPFYYRFTLQNLLPFLDAWERHLGTGSWTTADGLTVPFLGDRPQFARTQRWMLDLTLPDGTLAPIDDGNPGRSSYFGALPSTLPTAAAGYWRWADTPQPLETDGNVDLGPEAIVAYDLALAPAPPTWAPTQFYVEGGNAVFRSAWSDDATMALVLGEHDTASEFGRDRTGAGRYPQSHEHAEPGAFLLEAFGERLALDPGYLSFSEHDEVNRPEHHNVVLVDGAGPADYLDASFAWADDPFGRPPAEGQATIAATLDSGSLDAATVATAYRGATIARRFLFGDDRYLVVADAIDADPGIELTWMVHGNGGGTSGGTFEATATGGRWTIGGGRLDAAIASTAGTPSADTVTSVHEVPYGDRRTHTALAPSVEATGDRTTTLEVLYPTSSGAPAPVATRSSGPGGASVQLEDPTDDRVLSAIAGSPGTTAAIAEVAGGAELLVVDRRGDGTLRSAFADDAGALLDHGDALVAVDDRGSLGIDLGAAGEAEVVAAGSDDPTIEVGDVGFTPAAADGACGIDHRDGRTVVTANRERRITLRADGGNSAPAADPGPDQRVEATGTVVVLDGTASCDLDGDALTHRWELVSAPAGSAWELSGAATARPALSLDAVGPYRVRLTVTDARGATSLEQEVVILAGPVCGDGVDDDLDGRFDTDDPDCDGSRTPVTPTDPVAPADPVAPLAPPAEAVGGRPRYTG